jgi:EAL domain-containing protein (putative c-di-GMP-specific phosphodiesterase class I)
MSPSEFIPIAENSGLLPALGEWVLDRAMTDSKRWPHLEVGVNLSPVQFRHVDLAATLRNLVAKHDVDPSRFVLEITEGVLLDATEHTHAILDAFRLMGFKTALTILAPVIQACRIFAISASIRSKSTGRSLGDCRASIVLRPSSILS